MKIAITAVLAVIAFAAYAQVGFTPAKPPPARFEMLINTHGGHSVFRMDTQTGAITYCYTVTTKREFGAEWIQCVAERK